MEGMPLLPEPGPIRTLAAVTLVNTIGNGLWMTSSALFLTRSVGLSIGQTGLALTLVALINLVTSTPVGYLADRLGPRGVAIGALVALGLCETAMVGVRSMAGFLVVAAPMAVFQAAQRATRGAIIGGAVPPERRVHTRAYLRSITNVGITGRWCSSRCAPPGAPTRSPEPPAPPAAPASASCWPASSSR
jgi:MFS family permease